MKKRKNIVLFEASELYNGLLEIYLDKYNKISATKKERLGIKYNFDNLELDDYDFSPWFE